MTQWDRVNSMALEVAQMHARIRRLSDQWDEAQRDNLHLAARLRQAEESRDLARRVAMRLEQENHALGGGVCVLCAGQIVAVPLIGDAT